MLYVDWLVARRCEGQRYEGQAFIGVSTVFCLPFWRVLKLLCLLCCVPLDGLAFAVWRLDALTQPGLLFLENIHELIMSLLRVTNCVQSARLAQPHYLAALDFDTRDYKLLNIIICPLGGLISSKDSYEYYANFNIQYSQSHRLLTRLSYMTDQCFGFAPIYS
jgi:hypothetical protein